MPGRVFALPCIPRCAYAGLGTYKSQDIGGAVEASLRAGYRHIDCASHYGNEPLIGEAFTKILKEGVIKREQLFITSKLWYEAHQSFSVWHTVGARKLMAPIQI